MPRLAAPWLQRPNGRRGGRAPVAPRHRFKPFAFLPRAARVLSRMAPLPLLVLLCTRSIGPARAQAPPIQIAGATAASPLQLTLGCNMVVVQSASGTPMTAIAALVKPRDAVISIWRYDNATKVFRVGYFADHDAPTDFTVTGGSPGSGTPSSQVTEPYYVCLNQPASIAPA